MTTKKAVILTFVIILLAIVGGLGVMFALVDINSSGAEQKVAALGQVTGFVTVIPIFGVWIMWGLQMRKQNEQKPPQSKSKR
jgi:heme/copper-type cytochrome/quinol oxidase subunit 2